MQVDIIHRTYGLYFHRCLIARTIIVLTGNLMGNVCKKNNKSTFRLRRNVLNLNWIQLATEGNADIPSIADRANSSYLNYAVECCSGLKKFCGT